MRYVTIPHTSMQVSNICLGTGSLGTAVDADTSFAMLDAFVEAGGTFLDTAHVYADWVPGERHLSEKTIGRWLRRSGLREKVILATKGAHPDLATMGISRLSPQEIVDDLDESRDCLGVSMIDLYWLHRDDPARPVGEIIETLHAQVQAGKIRAFGCSNWQPGRIREAQEYAAGHGLQPFVASQILWSLAMPNEGTVPGDLAVMDEQAQAFYAAADLAVLAYTSQAQGFFAQAAAGGLAAVKEGARRGYENPTTLARLARAEELARALDTSVTAIVLASITSQPFVAVPIVGCKSLGQLHDSLAAADLILSPDHLRYLLSGERS